MVVGLKPARVSRCQSSEPLPYGRGFVFLYNFRFYYFIFSALLIFTYADCLFFLFSSLVQTFLCPAKPLQKSSAPGLLDYLPRQREKNKKQRRPLPERQAGRQMEILRCLRKP